MKHALRCLSGMALACLLAACASVPTPHFYTLQSGQAAPFSSPQVIPVYLANFSIPERVNRPQLVVRKSAEQVQILEQQLWAEPLKQALHRSLVTQLRVHGLDLLDSRAAPLELSVAVVNFESWPGKEVLLEVQWQLKNSAGTVVQRDQTSWRETITGTDTAAMVAAQQRAWLRIVRVMGETLSR